MEFTEALRLSKRWDKSKVCIHPRIEIETNRGVKTGDRVCTTCGEEFYDGKEETPNAKKPS